MPSEGVIPIDWNSASISVVRLLYGLSCSLLATHAGCECICMPSAFISAANSLTGSIGIVSWWKASTEIQISFIPHLARFVAIVFIFVLSLLKNPFVISCLLGIPVSNAALCIA